ncbi:FecR family protein [Patescibacteria group bacterium]|nr:FecR family protein [Patescibacteria group bacterium]
MNRITPLFLLLVAVVLVGVGCFRLSPRVVQDDVTPQVADTAIDIAPMAVLALDGTGTLTRGDQTHELVDGLELLPGDTIVAETGSVVLVYPDAGVSKLAPGTTITLLPDGEGEGSVFAHIELTAGSIWTRFERLLGFDERFSVNANNVVATVRGTAFGVVAVAGEADIQVADSEVEVSLLDARKNPTLADKVVRIGVGQALRIGASSLKDLDIAAARNRLRTLTAQERTRAEYRTIAQPLAATLLKKRASVRLDLLPDIPERFRDRIDPVMLERILRLNASGANPTFIAPFRQILPSDSAPSETPSDTATTTMRTDSIDLLGQTVK